jgi:hypothetical protein
LDTPSTFVGQIVGFAGDGTLPGSDQVDLTNMNYNNSIQSISTYNSSTGLLSVSNGTITDFFHFVGNYSQANFKFASDGYGGTIVYDPPINQPAPGAEVSDATIPNTNHSTIDVTAGAWLDNFVFEPGFGQVSVTNFRPETNAIQISSAIFTSVDALMAATHDDSRGNAVITDSAHDTIIFQNVTTAQLHAHQSDFFFV